MNTTTLTRIAPRLATVARGLAVAALGLAVVAMATVVLSTSALAEFTIYSETFSGDGSPLEGTIPDIGPIFVEWYAGETTFFADGTVDSDNLNGDPRGGGGAYLPIEPEAGRIYTASADIINITQGSMAFGFGENPLTDYIDDDSGRHDQDFWGTAWMGMAPNLTRFYQNKAYGSFLPDGDFTGLSGTYSFELTLDTNDADNTMVSARIDDNSDGSWVVWDLAPDSAGTAHNAGPLATFGDDNSGIHGIGFSVRGMGDGATVDGIDNFLLTVDVGPPTLGIRVNTVSGAITMLGPETGTVDLSYYDITSAGDSLDEAGWNSLAAQDYDGNGPPDDSGNGWEEGGSNGAHGLAEGYLLGSSTFGVGASVSLGDGYDTGVNAQDLFFTYSPGDGPVSRGLVQYVHVDLPGDFDGDGDVDGADLLLWQRDPGVGALGDWQDNFGTVAPPLAAAAGAVPEPASLALIGLGGLMLLYRRRA